MSTAKKKINQATANRKPTKKAKGASPALKAAASKPILQAANATFRESESASMQAKPGAGGMSGLDAAAKVLAETDSPLKCKAIVELAFEKGYWKSSGKTPAATINAAMIREITQKGEAARFAKAGRGLFAIRA